MTAAVEFQNVYRHFGDIKAVDNVSFCIPEGEFFSMLGPSGSGKTTCLRLIAGFEQPNKGHILIHNIQTENIPPYERDVNTVFQDYALFPHMSILENVAYGLMVRGIGKKERIEQAQEMLDLVKLPDVGARKPSQLSGGQRQRIALARALINKPRVLLLDEPLGALDLKLREQMQIELKALQRQVGITFVFVTHDQDEALSMSDRVAVFNNGKIEQIGTPSEIYNTPKTRFVAGFVGSTNIIAPELSQIIGLAHGSYSLRPERISLLDVMPAENSGNVTLKGRIIDQLYHGENTRLSIELASGHQFVVSNQNRSSQPYSQNMTPDMEIYLNWSKDDMHFISDTEA